MTVSERLILSRERLSQAIREHSGSTHGAPKTPEGTSVPAWFDSLKSIPGAPALLQTLGAWWAVHPLRVVSVSTADTVKTVVQPLAQRHPIGLVIGAAVVGILFVRSHPWRWLLKPALFAGLLPQVVATVVAQVPPQSWIKVLASMMQQTKTKDPAQQADPKGQKTAPSI